MKFLETENERISFAVTTVIIAILLLLCFFFGMSYFDPPPENGIAINFGFDEQGMGDVQPTAPPVSAPSAAPQSVEETDEVATQDDTDAPVITKAKPQPKPTPTQPVQKPSKETSDALNSFLNSSETKGDPNSGFGDNNTPGSKGREDGIKGGDPYGGGGGGGSKGSGYDLKGRKAVDKKEPKGCNENGTVVVQITVDGNGKVIAVTQTKGTLASACLIESAKAAAWNWKFDKGEMDKQVGTITFNFKVTE